MFAGGLRRCLTDAARFYAGSLLPAGFPLLFVCALPGGGVGIQQKENFDTPVRKEPGTEAIHEHCIFPQ